MTDKELLELAAKAAKYDVIWHENWQCYVHRLPINTDSPPTLAGQRLVWTPLTDGGDVFRLAVKLGIRTDVHLKRMEPFTRAWWNSENNVEEEHRDNANKATCRAIVRAAAEIGKTL